MKYKEYNYGSLAEVGSEVLKFWQENKVFEQSVESRAGKPSFVFYEGPPSANGKPGIHHVMARTIKDIFCRYKTLQGFQVKRKGGWDTHGLPIELQVEKELGITKEDIGKKISVAEYNQKCRETVMRYKALWDEITQKIGYWVDLNDPYITFENNYIESCWFLLKKLYEKGLLYKGYTIQPYSPAAGTGLSSHELNQPGCYKDVRDTTIVAQFKIKGTDHDYFLAWTTTPWTLPSNTALAVGKDIDYVKIKTHNQYTNQPTNVILAKSLLNKVLGSKYAPISQYDEDTDNVNKIPYTVIEEFKGSALEGVEYEQLMPYTQPLKDTEKAFKVLLGDFVTTEDGTGIVHISPTFGSDDFRLAQKYGVPPLMVRDTNGNEVPLVDKQGRFVAELGEFAGKFVKEEYYSDAERKNADFKPTDVLIAIKLKEENKAFKVEKYEHTYPHCWRTDKPVLYYPMESWFIKTTALKDRLVELNKTINWQPASTGEGRFGNWLENLVDWNLSRSRYWGTPLPIWRSEDGKEEKCMGSVAELNTEIEKSLKSKFYADLLKAVEALKTVLENKKEVQNAYFREDLGEIAFVFGQMGEEDKNFKGGFGISHIIAKREWEGQNVTELKGQSGFEFMLELVGVLAKGKIKPFNEGSEKRFVEYGNKTAILALNKEGQKMTWLLTGFEYTGTYSVEKNQVRLTDELREFFGNPQSTQNNPTLSRAVLGASILLDEAKVRKILQIPNILDEKIGFDLHRPYIDEIVLVSDSGKPMKRELDLIDVWFDSGAMPYAQWHYPFENEDIFKNSYPADFISEGVDQTRGWFFTLHAIAGLAFDSVAFKNVVSTGLVLDEKGNKMSKRLGNVIDPFETIDKYGADAVRWYMLENAPVWDNMKFSIKGLEETMRKFFGTLQNTYSFFALYANLDDWEIDEQNIVPYENRTELDRWIISCLRSLIEKTQAAYNQYDATTAAREIQYFVTEQLSNWYVRLSRRRFWKGEMTENKKAAYETLYECLNVVGQLMSPIAPFVAEWFYQSLTNPIREKAKANNTPLAADSVHLGNWTTNDKSLINKALESRMEMAQQICSLVHALRKNNKIKVRQPLTKILIPVLNPETQTQIEKVKDLIMSEINVKAVDFVGDDSGMVVKKAKPNFKKLGKEYGKNMKVVADQISEMTSENIAELERNNAFAVNLEGKKVNITLEDVEISTSDIEGWLVAREGNLTVALDTKITDELRQEGIARDLVNRIQNLRKDQGLEVQDKIHVKFLKAQDILNQAITTHKNYISEEVQALSLELVDKLPNAVELEIDEWKVGVEVRK